MEERGQSFKKTPCRQLKALDWDVYLKSTLCIHAQNKRLITEMKLFRWRSRNFRYIKIEFNFWIEWLDYVDYFWSKFRWTT